MPFNLVASTPPSQPDYAAGNFVTWQLEYDTDVAAYATLAGRLFFVWFRQAADNGPIGAFPTVPFVGQYLSGANVGYTDGIAPYYIYQFTGTETDGSFATMNFVYSPNTSLENLIRPARIELQFDRLPPPAAERVHVFVRIYWQLSADMHPPYPQSELMQNVGRLPLHRWDAANALDLSAGTSFYNAPKRLGVQAVLATQLSPPAAFVQIQTFATLYARFYNNLSPAPTTAYTLDNGRWELFDTSGTPRTTISSTDTTRVRLTVNDMAAGSGPEVNPIFFIFRVSTNNPLPFYIDSQGVEAGIVDAVTTPLVGIGPAWGTIPSANLVNSYPPVNVSGSDWQSGFDLQSLGLVSGESYRIGSIQVDADTGVANSFMSDVFDVVDCPLPQDPTQTESSLATDWGTYGPAITASVQQRISSRIGWNGAAPSTYNANRTIALGDAAQSVRLRLYYDETVGGRVLRQYVADRTILRFGGLWQNATDLQVQSTTDTVTVDYLFLLRSDSSVNLGTFDITNNVALPSATGNNQWNGRVIKLEYTVTLNQGAYTEDIVGEQAVSVTGTGIATVELTYDGTDIPVQQLCVGDGFIDVCFEDVGAATDVPYQLSLRPVGAGPQSTGIEYSADTGSTRIPQTDVQAIVDFAPFFDAYGRACGRIDTSRLIQGIPYTLCLVQKGQPFCYGLDFLGGADGTESEHVATTPTVLLDFGIGPFFVSYWTFMELGIMQGGAAVSRRPQVGVGVDEGWVVGHVGSGVQAGKVLASVENSPTDSANIITDNAALVDGWNHVVISFESLDPNTWKVYVNGVLEAITVAETGTLTTFDCAETPPLLLGRDTPADTDDYLQGRLANVFIAQQGISDVQALALYNDGICGNPTLLGFANAAWYDLNQSSGTTAPELVNSITGTLTNYSPARTATGGGAWQPV